MRVSFKRKPNIKKDFERCLCQSRGFGQNHGWQNHFLRGCSGYERRGLVSNSAVIDSRYKSQRPECAFLG